MKILLRYIIYFISRIIKTGNILVFQSFPDYSDNPYALYKYLINQKEYDKYIKVWILSSSDKKLKNEITNENNKVIITYSTIRNWFYLIRCKHIFSSHLSYRYLRFNQQDKIINLWHGMPLKKIGFDNSENKNEHYSLCIKTIATSEVFQNIMASAFKLSKQDVLVVGQPRNDMLFNKSDYLIAKGININAYKSIGIWMPTFRKTIKGDIVDTKLSPHNELSYYNTENLSKINTFLSYTNNYLILKLHPADILQKQDLGNYSNLLILKSTDICHRDVYPLLGQMDYLITDYSSVFVDFDILNKPMAFILADIEEYKNNRGFYFNEIEKTLPGKIIHNFDELLSFINNPLRINGTHPLIYNEHKDNNNCKRIVELLGL